MNIEQSDSQNLEKTEKKRRKREKIPLAKSYDMIFVNSAEKPKNSIARV